MVVAACNARTLAVQRDHGHGHDECVLAKGKKLGCDFIGLQETRRHGRTIFVAAGYQLFCCGQEGTAGRQGMQVVGLAVEEMIHRKSAGKCEAAISVAAYAPTDCTTNVELRRAFWRKLEKIVEQIPTKYSLFVLMDANVRTGRRVEEGNA